MKLFKCISPDTVILNIAVKDKTELFELMANALSHSREAKACGLDKEAILSGIVTREKQGATGIGNGLAFPHARFAGLENIVISIATLKEPIPYESYDNTPVKIACMVIVPVDKPTLALKAMSAISRLFNDKTSIEKLNSAVIGSDVVKVMKESELDLNVSITAADIMRDPILTFSPEMPLKEATWKMAHQRINVVPVLDAENHVIGEIACPVLFKIGVPDFFAQLKNVSFIRNYDPFEKYFFEEAHSKVGDVMDHNVCILPPSATLMEIVYEMAVNHRPKVFIVENGILTGIIDQTLVLERIINF